MELPFRVPDREISRATGSLHIQTGWLGPACPISGRAVVLVLVIALLVVYLAGRINYKDPMFADRDLHQYIRMAQAAPGIDRTVPEPYAYRLLGPYLAGLLPLPTVDAFYVLAAFAAPLLAVFLYIFLCQAGIPSPAALYTTVLFLLAKYCVAYFIWEYFQIDDLLTLVYLPLLFWSLMGRKWTVFSAVLLAGASTREPALLMIPVGLVFLSEKGLLNREAKWYLAAITPAVAAVILIRALVIPFHQSPLLDALLAYGPDLRSPGLWFRMWLNPFIPLSALPFVYPEDTVRFFRARKFMAFFLLLVFASSQFGSSRERTMAPAFIVFYLLYAQIIRDRIWGCGWLKWLLAATSVMAFPHHMIGRFPLFGRSTVIALTVASLLIVMAAGLFVRAGRWTGEKPVSA